MGNCSSGPSSKKYEKEPAKETPVQVNVKKEVKAKTSEEKAAAVDNGNWIKNITKEAHEGKYSKKVSTEKKILPGMEGKNDIIGGILFAMWPHMTKMIENEILVEVSKAINVSIKYIPAVNMFKFTHADMGEVYPRMRNFEILDTSNNSIILQMDLDYDGDCVLDMQIGTSLGTIPLGIKDIKLEGTMRVELKDLVDTAPLVSAIVAYFTDPPKLDFDLTKTANIADHPWISTTVRKIVVDGICTQLVDPHRIVVPLATDCAAKYRWPLPKHIWRITVVEAENLVNTDAGYMSFLSGKSDPYVKIFMNSENQAITPVISDNLNPVWNYSTIMRAYRDDVSVQFNLYDSDMSVGGVTVDPDDDLGCCSLKLNDIEDSFDGWLDLKNIEHGRVHVKAERFNPVDCESRLKSERQDVQMTQIWINEFSNIDTKSPGYETKQDVYTAKAFLSDGTTYDFGAGAYEPVHSETAAKWDFAHHHFGDVSDVECRLEVQLNNKVVYNQTINLSDTETIVQSEDKEEQTLSARVLVTDFEPAK